MTAVWPHMNFIFVATKHVGSSNCSKYLYRACQGTLANFIHKTSRQAHQTAVSMCQCTLHILYTNKEKVMHANATLTLPNLWSVFKTGTWQVAPAQTPITEN